MAKVHHSAAMHAGRELKTLTDGFLKFVDSAVTPFHCVDQVRQKLVAAGFSAVKEKDVWSLQQGGKYFFTRNQSSIVAFVVGGKFVPGNSYNIVAAHTDSPHLKVKPKSLRSKAGYVQLGVECYGGGLWNTWFDRDLTVAGRVILKNGGEYQQRLVHVKRPLMTIPNLAIHLNRSIYEDGFKPNKETHVLPVLATQVISQLEGDGVEGGDHPPELLNALASDIGCQVSDIHDFELSIVDTQPAAIGGAHRELIFSPRLDNLMSCYCGLEALLDADSTVAEDTDVRVLAMFDHEEIGSQSAQGAGSSLLTEFLHRMSTVFAAPPQLHEVAVKKSFLVSIDQAHAIHPNYQEKHEDAHKPAMHKGIVIKTNQNQRYATNAITGFVLRELCRRNEIPCQEFVVRNDSACGSTIGPMLSASVGIRTVDIGMPQLGMHSIRETMGTSDVGHGYALLKVFYEQFRSLDDTIQVD
eukprot:JP446103.1.p2 GENE.JP446103.1~~JP446103.1.p2  ORF type:complete len:476 (+),score=158.26 JP446103.1:25-1428(+)